MSFQHRKLLNDSIEDSVEKTCKSYCDPSDSDNLDGGCPVVCIARCYGICNHPLFDGILPPSPDLTGPALSDKNDSDHHPTKPSGLSVFLSISLLILATVFVVFCFYSAYKFYRGRSNSRSRQSSSQPPGQQPPEEEAHLEFLDEDRGPVVDHPIWYIRTVGLQPSVISAISICKYKRGDGLVEGTECSVCLNEFQDDETLRLLPKCNHAFHIPCIDTWLASHTNCPNCRAGIVMSTPHIRSSAQSLQNSGLNSSRLEESQVGVSGNNVDMESERERERESGVLDVSIEVEDEEESRADEIFMENVVGSSSSSGSGEREGIEPLRRSVSLDLLSASAINTAIANAFSVESERNSKKISMEMNGLTVENAPKGAGGDQSCSSSAERSQPKETSLVKRSLSCSAKVFLSRYNKSRNSSLAL